MKKLMESIPVKLLLIISKQNNYLSRIMRELVCTYSHIVKVADRLEKLKIITKKKEGRKTEIKLTKKGLEVREHLMAIQRLI